jgi:hypothetical protein
MLVPVCNGVRGNVLSIDLPTNALVEELSHSLKRHTDIDVESQVLMCEWEPDSGLSHRRTVASYGMPRQDEQIICVFNKAYFKQGASAAQAPEESAPVVRAQLPTQEQSLSASHCSLVNNLSLKANQAGVEPMQVAALLLLYCYFTTNLLLLTEGARAECDSRFSKALPALPSDGRCVRDSRAPPHPALRAARRRSRHAAARLDTSAHVAPGSQSSCCTGTKLHTSTCTDT